MYVCFLKYIYREMFRHKFYLKTRCIF